MVGEGRRQEIGPLILWMSGALAAFIFASLGVRHLTATLDAFEIGVVRTGVGLVLLVGMGLAVPGLRAGLRRSSPLQHIPRNLVHATGGVAWTLAIAGLPFATVFALEFTAPAWVALLAYPILRERITGRTVAGIALCSLGVLVILRPGIEPLSRPVFEALAAAFCFGLSIVLTRRLGRTQTVFAILFWMMVWQLLFYFAATTLSGSDTLVRAIARGDLLLPALGLGVAGMTSQLCLARALQMADAATVVPLDFLRVPLIAIVGWLFYGEPLSLWVFAGALLILAGITHGLVRPLSASPVAAAP